MRLTIIFLIGFMSVLHPLPGMGAIPATQPATQPIIISTTQPVAVPYKLTDTNHILIRLKINGKGPFNFIVDTGAPVMILRVPAAQKIGLKPNSRGMATLTRLDIEGGLSLKRVQCLVDTPYQIEGMNAIGASGVELDGLLGYGILARFRMQIDLTKDHMIWTPVDFVPSPFIAARTSSRAPGDPQENQLEAMGGLLKLMGPLVKPDDVESKHRGLIGIELTEANGRVSVQRVLGDSPAQKAGIFAGDRVLLVNQKTVNTITDAQQAMANTLTGQTASVVVRREQSILTLHLICAEGL